MSNYDKDIEEYWHERMPEEIKEVFDKAINDLYTGPSYFDADGNEVSCFDEGAIHFDFSAACTKLRDWADENMTPLYLEEWCEMLQEDPPANSDEAYYCWDEHSQKKIVFGELAPYL